MAWIADIPVCHQAVYRALDRGRGGDMKRDKTVVAIASILRGFAEDYRHFTSAPRLAKSRNSLWTAGALNWGRAKVLPASLKNSVTFST